MQQASLFHASRRADERWAGWVSMLCAPALVLRLTGPGAVAAWRDIVTAANHNTDFLYASASVVDAARDADFFFGTQVRMREVMCDVHKATQSM